MAHEECLGNGQAQPKIEVAHVWRRVCPFFHRLLADKNPMTHKNYLTPYSARRLPLWVLMVCMFMAWGTMILAETGEDFTLDRPYGKLGVSVISPPSEKLAKEPLLLLNFSSDRRESLPGGKYGGIAQPFLDAGNRIASFDLPQHGERIDKYGSGIAGMSASVAAGQDPFAVFVEDGRSVIDELIKRGLATEGKIMICGVSRGGYCALRLASADNRVSAVCALAPVTDWAALEEFAAIKDRPAVEKLAMTHFAENLAGRRVYAAIGNADTRVSTAACTRFILALNEVEARRNLKESSLRFLIVDDSRDHSLNSHWRKEGIQFLLRTKVSVEQENLPQ